MKCHVIDARVDFKAWPFLSPLQLSSGPIAALTEARASVRVSVEGKEATGHGSIFLSYPWAWPGPEPAPSEKDGIVREFCRTLAYRLLHLSEEGAHPLELGLRLHHEAEALASPVALPLLARAMCASPLDAAIHDAAGIALDISAFKLYEARVPIPSADALFPGGAIAAIGQTLRAQPLTELDAWLVASPHDDLAHAAELLSKHGYRCFKLKLAGNDPRADADFTARFFAFVTSQGVPRPRLSADPNCAYSHPQDALQYLETLRSLHSGAFAALEYLEQPTGRDIISDGYHWHAAAGQKPIFLDEGLTGFDVLPAALELGYSGLALKTCKGHSFSLVAAAWARRHGLKVALQDLTNPGLSLIHAALFAAYVPTVNGAEMNSPQFVPNANEAWLPRLASLFQPSNGRHVLPAAPVGLGSIW